MSDDDFKVSDNDRVAAENALTRWLDECERAASDRWARGVSGYLGRIKLCAFVSDEGITLRVERSISEDL